MTAPWVVAFDAKLDLINWLKTAEGSKWVAVMLSEINEGRVMGQGDPMENPYLNDPGWIDSMAAQGMGPGLAAEMVDGETFWVSPDMTSLIDVAVNDKGFDMEQKLRTSDVPAPAGMIFFEHPLDDDIAKMDAISWCPSPMAGIQMSVWTKTERWHRRAGHNADVAHWLPKTKYMLIDTHDWEFGAPVSDLHIIPPDLGGVGLTDGARGLMLISRRWIYGAMLMMQQKIARHQEEHLPRHVSKRGMKAGVQEFSAVRCIVLRREMIDPHGHLGAGESINYSHRFMVSGHWKPQWYPSVEEHRMIYIAPYIKGPKDKPLIIKDTVYALRR